MYREMELTWIEQNKTRYLPRKNFERVEQNEF
jgi:hypothetical protein